MQKSGLLTGYTSYLANKELSGDFQVLLGADKVWTLPDRCAYCWLMMVRYLKRGYVQKACTNQAHSTRYLSYLADKVLSGDFSVVFRCRQGADPAGQVCLLFIGDGHVLDTGFMQQSCTNQAYLTRYTPYLANKVI